MTDAHRSLEAPSKGSPITHYTNSSKCVIPCTSLSTLLLRDDRPLDLAQKVSQGMDFTPCAEEKNQGPGHTGESTVSSVSQGYLPATDIWYLVFACRCVDVVILSGCRRRGEVSVHVSTFHASKEILLADRGLTS